MVKYLLSYLVNLLSKHETIYVFKLNDKRAAYTKKVYAVLLALYNDVHYRLKSTIDNVTVTCEMSLSASSIISKRHTWDVFPFTSKEP